MQTFIMLGKYSQKSMEKISKDRTRKADRLVKSHGGEIKAIYALLGDIDLVVVARFPSIEQAMKVSVALAKATGITFVTSPALPVEQFDKLMDDV